MLPWAKRLLAFQAASLWLHKLQSVYYVGFIKSNGLRFYSFFCFFVRLFSTQRLVRKLARTTKPEMPMPNKAII